MSNFVWVNFNYLYFFIDLLKWLDSWLKTFFKSQIFIWTNFHWTFHFGSQLKTASKFRHNLLSKIIFYCPKKSYFIVQFWSSGRVFSMRIFYIEEVFLDMSVDVYSNFWYQTNVLNLLMANIVNRYHCMAAYQRNHPEFLYENWNFFSAVS